MSGHSDVRRRKALTRCVMACVLVAAVCSSVRAASATPEPGLRLTVVPNRALIDQSLTVRLTGLSAGEQVNLSCRYTDGFGTERQSHATFRADSAGTVDLASQAPIAGTYRGVDPMGLIWSIASLATPSDIADLALTGFHNPDTVTFTAEVGQHVVARATAQRYLLSSAIGQRSLETKGLYGEFYWPKGKSGVPAVLVVGGSEGGLNPVILREAALLAAHGYAALALAYFDDPGLPSMLARIPLEYFMRALDWLQARPMVDRRRLAVMGTSRGGELALLLAAHDPRLKAVISYSGSGVAQSAVGKLTVPAWTLHGKPIPWAQSSTNWQQAVIPVHQIHGPMLLIAGNDDQVWPSRALLQVAMNEAHTRHHPFEDQLLTYAGAGHLLLPPYFGVEATVGFPDGGDAKDQDSADVDSWAHILRLLATRFSS